MRPAAARQPTGSVSSQSPGTPCPAPSALAKLELAQLSVKSGCTRSGARSFCRPSAALPPGSDASGCQRRRANLQPTRRPQRYHPHPKAVSKHSMHTGNRVARKRRAQTGQTSCTHSRWPCFLQAAASPGPRRPGCSKARACSAHCAINRIWETPWVGSIRRARGIWSAAGRLGRCVVTAPHWTTRCRSRRRTLWVAVRIAGLAQRGARDAHRGARRGARAHWRRHLGLDRAIAGPPLAARGGQRLAGFAQAATGPQ